MNEIPKPEDIWDGKAPEDDVTPEKFTKAIRVLRDFVSVDTESISSLEDLVRATRDVGDAIRSVVKSSGSLEVTEFSFKDPKIEKKGDDLIASGDIVRGQSVKNDSERTLVDKIIALRARKEDGSTTVSTFSGKSLVSEYHRTEMISNYVIEEEHQLTRYKATVPTLVDLDRIKYYHSVHAVDHRSGKPVSFYPTQDGADVTIFRGYFSVLKDLVQDILTFLDKEKHI